MNEYECEKRKTLIRNIFHSIREGLKQRIKYIGSDKLYEHYYTEYSDLEYVRFGDIENSLDSLMEFYLENENNMLRETL